MERMDKMDKNHQQLSRIFKIPKILIASIDLTRLASWSIEHLNLLNILIHWTIKSIENLKILNIQIS